MSYTEDNFPNWVLSTLLELKEGAADKGEGHEVKSQDELNKIENENEE